MKKKKTIVKKVFGEISFLVKKIFQNFLFCLFTTTVTTVPTVTTVTSDTTVPTVTTVTTVNSITVKYRIVRLYSGKVNFFTKSYDQPTDRPTTRLLELLEAAKNIFFDLPTEMKLESICLNIG